MLISAQVSNEFKLGKTQSGLTWTNLIGLGLKYKEVKDENLYLWGKLEQLREEIETLKKQQL